MPSTVTGVIQDLERILLSPAQISARVDAMAARLNVELAGKVVTVVALMDGGLFFVADLLRRLEMPVRLYTLSASSYQGGTTTTGEVKVNWPANFDLRGQDVLLLDDILDTASRLAPFANASSRSSPPPCAPASCSANAASACARCS